MWNWLRKMLPMPAGPQGMLQGITRSAIDPPKRGTREHLEVYETAPWPRAVGDKVATAVAFCDFELVAKTKNGKAVKDVRLQRASMAQRSKLVRAMDVHMIEGHPFMAALDMPNPFMDRIGLLKLTELHLDFVGDAFWLKDRAVLGHPVGFWPIPPQWVMETPREDNGNKFRVSYKAWQAWIPSTEIHWFHEPAPANPYTRGTGIGWSLGDEIQVDEYAAKMAAAFFFNRARPDFVFATGLGEEETRRLEQDWLQRLQGFYRAHRPYFLAGGEVDLQKQIREFQQPTMEQLVYPNLRKVQRDIILQVWGVPPEMFGIVENSNRAVIESAEYFFTKWVVWPKAERIRASLQRLVIEDYDERIVLHVCSPVAEDKAHQLAVMSKAPWNWTRDEWRAAGGSGPATDGPGNERAIPMNYGLKAIPWDVKTQADVAGILVRAGYEPADALKVAGLPPMGHTGLPPVTVQGEDTGPPQLPPGAEKPPKPGEEEDAA